VERGWGVNILEDARHSSVLYIYKYFVALPVEKLKGGYQRKNVVIEILRRSWL
jgi:hypothetical protein